MPVEDIKDVRDPLNMPFDGWVWLVLFGIAIFGGYWAFRFFSRRRNIPQSDSLPVISAWQWAWEALEHLEQEELPAKGEIAQYFYKLSNIVRGYLERRFAINALEMTTEEFLYHTQSSAVLSDMQKDYLRDFLDASDRVKFARFLATQEQMANALALARRLIEETKQT